MPGGALVLGLDVGTTGVRALLVDDAGRLATERYREVLPTHPAPGLVEHDGEALWAAVVGVIGEALREHDTKAVRGLGITGQRGAAVVWERHSGRTVHPAISWSDARAEARCSELMSQGILVSPLMAASKIEWILDRVDADRAGVRSGRLRCGTIDTWLASRLTGGAVFATDPSNAVPLRLQPGDAAGTTRSSRPCASHARRSPHSSTRARRSAASRRTACRRSWSRRSSVTSSPR
jgi:glycerol kinase